MGIPVSSCALAVVLPGFGLALLHSSSECAPRLPAHWQRLQFKLFERGQQREFVCENTSLS